jgi:hypothetical protein
LKADAYFLFCAGKECTNTSSNAECCEKDVTKCAGAENPISCGTNQYLDPAKAADNINNVKTACCTARMSCVNYAKEPQSVGGATQSGSIVGVVVGILIASAVALWK